MPLSHAELAQVVEHEEVVWDGEIAGDGGAGGDVGDGGGAECDAGVIADFHFTGDGGIGTDPDVVADLCRTADTGGSGDEVPLPDVAAVGDVDEAFDFGIIPDAGLMPGEQGAGYIAVVLDLHTVADHQSAAVLHAQHAAVSHAHEFQSAAAEHRAGADHAVGADTGPAVNDDAGFDDCARADHHIFCVDHRTGVDRSGWVDDSLGVGTGIAFLPFGTAEPVVQLKEIDTQIRDRAYAALRIRGCLFDEFPGNHQAGNVRIFQRDPQEFLISAEGQQRDPCPGSA